MNTKDMGLGWYNSKYMRGVWERLRSVSLLAVSASLFMLVFGWSLVQAASPNISKSYDSNQSIPNGSLVSLGADKNDFVVLANTDNSGRLIGVGVDSSDSLLAVDPEDSKVQVATSGSAVVLVSTLSGEIKPGDQIGASPFNGIGMKAQQGVRVIGLAQTAFNESSEGGARKQVTDKDGKSQQVYVGYVRVSIAVGSNAASSTDKLNPLQKAVQSLTGRTIATWRIVASLTVLTVAFLVLVTLIYSSIYSGIVSIGRNPLAKYSVFRAMGTVMAMAVGIVIVAGLSVFLLLR